MEVAICFIENECSDNEIRRVESRHGLEERIRRSSSEVVQVRYLHHLTLEMTTT